MPLQCWFLCFDGFLSQNHHYPFQTFHTKCFTIFQLELPQLLDKVSTWRTRRMQREDLGGNVR